MMTKEIHQANKQQTTPSPSSKPIIAAFDFDGTITTRDLLFDFLLFSFGFWKTFFGFIRLIPTLLCFLFSWLPRQTTKERILTYFFAGKKVDDLRILGQRFAKEKLPDNVRPEAFKRILWHKERGDTLIIISASIDLYIKPWGEALGFTHFLTSELEENHTGQATGKLIGLNCRGAEKVRRLKHLCGPIKNYTLYAYGDSEGDKELLDAADHSYFKCFN